MTRTGSTSRVLSFVRTPTISEQSSEQRVRERTDEIQQEFELLLNFKRLSADGKRAICGLTEELAAKRQP
jgi:hypothetical protein